jgi:hypothetical protein
MQDPSYPAPSARVLEIILVIVWLMVKCVVKFCLELLLVFILREQHRDDWIWI